MRRKTRRFTVHANFDNVELARTGSSVHLIIDSRGERLGEIQIGRGGLFWWGAYRKKRKRIRWSKFAEVMDHIAYGGD